VRYENGALGSFAVSQISAGRKNSLRVEIDGSRGAAAWASESPDELWLGPPGAAERAALPETLRS